MLDKLKETDNYNKLQELKEEFSRYFISKNYCPVAPLPIISKEDPTVQFIGSSTNVFKKQLLNEDNELSFTVQPCFRARNINELLDDNSTFKWGSLFTMFGTIGGPSTYSKQSNEIFSFLTDKIGIPIKQLCLQVHNDDSYLLEPWKNKKDLNFEIGQQPESYYRWKYGEEGITGKGVSLAMISHRDEKPYELGNIIEISKNNKVIAIEMGFGLECLIARLNEKAHTIEVNALADFFNLEGNNRKKYADAIMVSMVLIQNGITPSARGQGRVLREYTKGIVYAIIKQNISKEKIADTLLKVELAIAGKNIGLASKLYNEILDMYENITAICKDISSQTSEEIIKLLNKKDI